MIKKKIIGALLVLLVFNVFLLLKVNQISFIKLSFQNDIKSLEIEIGDLKNQLGILSECMFWSLESNYSSLSELKPVLNNECRKLILRYSELNCHSCVDSQIVKLNEFSKKLEKGNILILAHYKNERDLYLFRKKNPTDLKFINIGSLDIAVEKANTPYYFIIDNDFTAKSVFVPAKELPEQTERYFDVVKRKYFD